MNEKEPTKYWFEDFLQMEVISEEKQAEEHFLQEYIPESVGDEAWEEFASRIPLPPLEQEEEELAVSMGLRELQKMKQHFADVQERTARQFQSMYPTYIPLLQDPVTASFQQLFSAIEELELLISGQLDKIQAVNDDMRMFAALEEKRLSVLHAVLDSYKEE